MKLASHLNGQNGLYILDEPAVGLHGQDVARLLEVLDDLTRRGNTIVVIEHHLDVIAHADWVIDMGPEGGKRGGQVLFSGTPEQLLSVEHSATAEYPERCTAGRLVNCSILPGAVWDAAHAVGLLAAYQAC